MQIAMDGMSFVVVGIKPTDSGADFFTAVHGDREDLRNAVASFRWGYSTRFRALRYLLRQHNRP